MLLVNAAKILFSFLYLYYKTLSVFCSRVYITSVQNYIFQSINTTSMKMYLSLIETETSSFHYLFHVPMFTYTFTVIAKLSFCYRICIN